MTRQWTLRRSLRIQTRQGKNGSSLSPTGSDVLLLAKLGGGVRDLDVKLLGPLDNQLPRLGRHIVGDFCAILLIVHEQHLQLFRVVHQKLVEAIRQKVSGFLVGAKADGRLWDGPLEAPPHARIDTLLLPPRTPGNAEETIRLVSSECLRTLLDNLGLDQGLNLGHGRLIWGKGAWD